ncbi:MAG TPA: PIG-L family deacetylase [Longimicrobiaceae bacterium]
MKALLGGSELEAGPTLVLAPHGDDEVVGCGGWLIRTRGAHFPRTVAFLVRRDTQRREDGRAALAGLEVEEVDLDLPERRDRAAPALEEGAARLSELLRRLKPAHLLLPRADDPHPDHRLAAALLRRAVTAELPGAPSLLVYEGLVPLGDANRLLDLTGVMEEKLARLRSYESQDARYGLTEMVKYLNAYRARTLLRRGIRFAEAYHQVPSSGVRKWLELHAC